ncbi:MAG: pyridoxal phosphate-dependent aminotransferase family protein [Elusimicrobiota bacterium]|nr:pyridoxal phosphate-dependent aminotransferase family protein [Elusimicrobiota bacterium]
MKDLFDKCRKFNQAKQIQELGLYPYFHKVETGQDPVVRVESREMIMMGSNNYLGLTSCEELKKAANAATDEFGVGCVGSRFLNGTLKMHEELEKKLAEFVNKSGALIFSTGMLTNLGVISSLVGRNDIIFADKYDHASIIDGCTMSFGKLKRFKHNDIRELEKLLKKADPEKGKLIVVDGVFSMEGDLADLPAIVKLAKKYGARLMVDDAHGLGVMGKTGRGTVDYFGLTDEVDIIVGTFSKSFAATGGFVATDEEVIHFLKHNARALIFTASPAPSTVATVLKAIELIKNEPQRIKKLWENTENLRSGFEKLGYDTGESVTPIIPLIIGENITAFKMWRALFDSGVFTTPVVSPAVPENRALIRVSVMATFEDEHIRKALGIFAQVGKELGII